MLVPTCSLPWPESTLDMCGPGQTAAGARRCLGHGEARGGGTPLAVAGPMWTGPLHNAEDIRAMADEAKALRCAPLCLVLASPFAAASERFARTLRNSCRRWTGHSAEGAAPQRSKKNGPRRLEQLLEVRALCGGL